MSTVLRIFLAAVIAYLMGSISPSIIQGRMHGVDIKKEGSGNAGTTNTLRVLGRKAALITLTVDIAKGVIAVLIGNALGGEEAGYLCALAVFCGHIWPCFFGFKGGKGVATAFGALLGVNWLLGVLALAIVALGVVTTMKMSVGSVLGAATFPVVCWFVEPGFIFIGTIMAVIILVKHRSNIQRLIRGEEPKMSFKKK
ncbi:MAG: glycerol-3-phosphate 1-O-acyltransferase PlsY [Firmicutes bacterium]|nr:glycerol-3-phosphate 1-O-acyltransferase PlsY [Bacillota bacterium]